MNSYQNDSTFASAGGTTKDRIVGHKLFQELNRELNNNNNIAGLFYNFNKNI
jgi:hypothetical protein